jgi:predicted metalloprotease with PDZ domain
MFRTCRLAGILSAALVIAVPLSAQSDATPSRAPRARRSDSMAAAADSLRMSFDSTRRRNFWYRDSIAPMMAQAFASRRVRIGVVVRTRPSETDSIGALLDAVTPGGPAAGAGLRAGDIIVKFGSTPLAVRMATAEPGVRVPNPGFRLVELVAQLQPNDTVAVQFRRGKEQKTVQVVTAAEPDNLAVMVGPEGEFTWKVMPDGQSYSLGQQDAERALDLTLRRSEMARGSMSSSGVPYAFMSGGPMLDLELAPVNPQLGSYFGTTVGVLVVDVPDPAPLGLKAGDVVLSVDGRKVTGPGQLMRILGSYGPDEPVRLEVMRQKKRINLTGTIQN